MAKVIQDEITQSYLKEVVSKLYEAIKYFYITNECIFTTMKIT